MKKMEYRFDLGRGEKHLWTRERAKTIRADIESHLESLPEGGTLVIDANGVEVFDYSFANELFGKIQLRLAQEFPGRFVVIENLNAYTRENLEQALESLSLTMIERRGRTRKTLRLLGKAHVSDVETFAVVARASVAVSASELAQKLDVTLTAMNERLSKLTKLGLLRRRSAASRAGRAQYEYSVLR